MKLSPSLLSITLALLLLPSTRAQSNLEPEVFTLNFTEEIAPLLETDTETQRPDSWPEWIVGLSQNNGAIIDNRAWEGTANEDGTETGFNLLINNSKLTGDLALTLSFSSEVECDFAIQIYDDTDKIVAVDLFGNVPENSVLGGTDTYIVPVSRYPSAKRIAIRQISGQLTLYGLLAFPVLSELPVDTEAEMTLLNLLGGELSEESRLYQALNDILPGSDSTGRTDADGNSLSREEMIKSLRTEVIRDLAKNESEFEQRLIGTEWYLEDFYRRRLARFLPGGRMLQQHADDPENLSWNKDLDELERGYRVLNANSVLFGIGGFVATFNDNFTEMTYETTAGRKGKARLVGRFKQ